jgi:putative phosphonate metabolism protein
MAESGNVTSRYAIYFSPKQECDLFRLGSQWLGRNAIDGESLDPALSNGLARAEWRRATESPRRYGFHATLKPPFRLAEGATYAELRSVVHNFAANCRSFKAPPLTVGRLGRFVALTLSEPSAEFSVLAAECVRTFHRFRAPATEEELAIRLRDTMSDKEREHLLRWGYPYVFDTWKFHMSLTGSLPEEQLPYLERVLLERFAPVCGRSFAVDSICIFHEPAPGSLFQLVEQAELRS